MLLSPAKTLDGSPLPASVLLNDNLSFTHPDCCVEKTAAIARFMKKLKATELSKLLKLSAALTEQTHAYWQKFQIEFMLDGTTDFPEHNSKPCIYTYSGAAFQGIQIQDCDVNTLIYMQENVRILDALYGLLRPLDLIQPYRLEMDTKNVLPHGSKEPVHKLSAYWSESVATRLTYELERSNATTLSPDHGPPILLNLASEEYSAAVDVTRLPSHCRYVKAVFWEDQRVVAVHAKRARGLMVRYLSERQATAMDDILQFDLEGYQYMASKSDENTVVFNRSKQSGLKTKAADDGVQPAVVSKRSKQK